MAPLKFNSLLSNKIDELSLHFKKFKKDKHSSLGLAKSVNRRKTISLLKENDLEILQYVIKNKFKEIMFEIKKEELLLVKK